LRLILIDVHRGCCGRNSHPPVQKAVILSGRRKKQYEVLLISTHYKNKKLGVTAKLLGSNYINGKPSIVTL